MIFGTTYGVATFNSSTNTWAKLSFPPGYPINFFSTSDVVVTKSGEWYFGSETNRIDIYNPKTSVWRSTNNFPTLSIISPLGLDLRNNLYALTYTTQLQIARYDTVNQSWVDTPLAVQNGLSGSYLTGFTVDKRNVMWYFSQYKGGVVRFYNDNGIKYNIRNSPIYSDSVAKVAVSPTNLKYILGRGGVIQILDDSALPSANSEIGLQTAKIISSYNNPVQHQLILNIEKTLSVTQLTIQIHSIDGKLVSQNALDVSSSIVELNTSSLLECAYFVTCID